MPSTHKKLNIFESEEGKLVMRELRSMMLDDDYKTDTSYTANAMKHPDHRMPFIENHLNYLSKHPELNSDHYISNLRISLKIRK